MGGEGEGPPTSGASTPLPGETSTTDRRTRRGQRTRRRIGEAALELFSEQGYEATTIQEIAARANVALRTYYYHFDSKADVALAWFNDWSLDLANAIDAQPEHAPPTELLSGALAMLAEKGYPGAVAWADPEGSPALPPQVRALLEVADPPFAGLVHQRLVFGFRRLAGVFRTRLGYGESDFEPYAIAGAILSLWFVAVHGSQDVVQRGGTPLTFHEMAQRTFAAYAEGLDRLWADRQPPAAAEGTNRPDEVD